MRELTSLSNSNEARRLASYLAVQGIRASAEEEDDNWVIWIHDDDDREQSKKILAEYQQNPSDPRYEAAERKVRSVFLEAERLQKEISRDERRLKKRWSGSWWHCYPATYIIIGICILVALVGTEWKPVQTDPNGIPLFCNRTDSKLLSMLMASNKPAEIAFNNRLTEIVMSEFTRQNPANKSDPDSVTFAEPQDVYDNWTETQRRIAHAQCGMAGVMATVSSGEVWRFVTPAFIHLSLIHIIFNLMAFRNLGSAIEYTRGTTRFVTLCLLLAIASAVVQILWSGPRFGGISGVIFGLVGYIWVKGKTRPKHGLGMTSRGIVFAFFWLFLCMAGVFGNIANGAHVGGFVAGMVLGGRESLWDKIRPSRNAKSDVR